MAGQEIHEELPEALVLEGAPALRLLAHEARQRVINEIYDGRELTATQAAELCGLSASAMSYHLRMLEKAGVLLASPGQDGRERRYRRAARRFEVHGRRGSPVQLKSTVSIWLDGLTRAVDRWIADGTRGSGGLSTESFRLTEQENQEMLDRVRAVFREYGDLSEGRGEQGGEYSRWETYWAHIPRGGSPGPSFHRRDG